MEKLDLPETKLLNLSGFTGKMGFQNLTSTGIKHSLVEQEGKHAAQQQDQQHNLGPFVIGVKG